MGEGMKESIKDLYLNSVKNEALQIEAFKEANVYEDYLLMRELVSTSLEEAEVIFKRLKEVFCNDYPLFTLLRSFEGFLELRRLFGESPQEEMTTKSCITCQVLLHEKLIS